MQGSGRGLAYCAGLAALLTAAGQFVLSRRGVLAGLGADDLAALRFAVSGLVFLPFLLRLGIADLAGVGWRRGAVLAVLGGAPYYGFMVAGLEFAPAAHVVVLNPGMTLVCGFVLATLWLGEEWTRFHAAALVAAGTGLVLMGWESIGNPSGAVWIGDLLFAVTGAAWGLLTVLLRRWSIAPLHAVTVVSSLSILYLPIYALFLSPNLHNVATSEIVLQGLYQGLAHGSAGLALYTFAVGRLGSGTVALMTPIVPATGLTMSFFFLGEWLSALQWSGAACVLIAMVLVAMQTLRPAPARA